jgi:TonB family protein
LNRLQKTIFARVFGTHISVLLLMLFIPWVKGCLHPKPKEIITFIDFAAMPPPPQESEPEPEPVVPKPVPVPKPKPVPKPAKTNTPPKKAATNAPPKKTAPKPEPKKAEPKKAESKPKTLQERLAEVRKGGKPVKATSPAPPKYDFTGIQSALGSAATGSGSGSGSGVYSPFAGYYDSIKQKMYSVWRQPAGAPIGLSAIAAVRVERDGTVSRKSVTRRSGNAPFDQSVQNALDATTRLPIPPADLPSRDIEIEFVLAD